MTEVRTSSLCERPCAGIEDTLEASIGTGGPQSVFDAAMAPTQESGLRENCTSRLSERAEAGRTLHLSRLYSFEAGEQRGAIRRGVGGAKDGDQGECGPAKHALDSEPGSRVTGAGPHTACLCRHTPEVGAVCGKAARTVLCGGRAMKRTSLPLHGASACWRTKRGFVRRVISEATVGDQLWQIRISSSAG